MKKHFTNAVATLIILAFVTAFALLMEKCQGPKVSEPKNSETLNEMKDLTDDRSVTETTFDVKVGHEFFVASGSSQDANNIFRCWAKFENRGYESLWVEIFTDSGGSLTKLSEYFIEARYYFWWFDYQNVRSYLVPRTFILKFFSYPKTADATPLREERVTVKFPLRVF